MAEFSEVMRQWRRMCDKMREHGDWCHADQCPLGGICQIPSTTDTATVEGIVMSWAAEHPEPVYQTWGEWFVEHGDLVDGWQNATNSAWMANTALSIFMNPIPADIAQKLGIEPKEG